MNAPTLPPAKSGAELIGAYLKNLPDKPGVYRMLNAAGEVLYVGKAKNLKKRVNAYATGRVHSQRLTRMVADTTEMIFVITESETDALLLENNLIKRFKPRYNVSFRDDKSFPYILLRRDHTFPQILKHRGAHTIKGTYFGPFANAGAVTRTLDTLQRAFLLRSCPDSVFNSRTRPCLLYQIKRCTAPCVGYVDRAAYDAQVQEAEAFLKGKSRAVQERVRTEMAKAAEALDYERAAQLRDQLRAMSHIQAGQGVNPATFAEADLFAAHTQGGRTCIQVFFFRANQNWGNRPYFPRHADDLSLAEVLESFIGQFYDDRMPPGLVLTSEALPGAALLAGALGMRAGHKVEIVTPKRGEKHAIMAQALTNAREQLARRLAENSAQTELLEGVAKVFGLEAPPSRIEVYDNSHIQGAHALGAFIVAGPEGFVKAQYRKFNIKTTDLAPGDDYAMMREVLTRRFTRMLKEETGDDQKGHDLHWTRPDLVIIDGGPGQLSVAVQVFADLGVENVPLVAISKGPDRDAGREHFYVPGRAPFRLETRNPVLYYLQRLRDESHRFVIGSHRKKRSTAIGSNPLDEITGVGAGRKRALLQHFGSARAVSAASLADLAAVPGVSQALAHKIYDFFHPD
jgi:excinuclease ABC subunit C